MKTYPGDFDPPVGSRYFSFRITRDDGRHEVSIGYLTDEELAWAARVIDAELERRSEAKGKRRNAMVPATANTT